MPRISFTILLILAGNCLFAQYVHYSDKRNINNNNQRSVAAPKPAANSVKTVIRDTVKIVVHDTIRVVIRDTIKITARDTVKIIVHDTVRVATDKVVYHKWPDRCPGLSGAVPVLTNYVPKDIIPKITEIYKGHLYSITSIKAANNKLNYKLKVCENGEIKFEYADEKGDIIKK